MQTDIRCFDPSGHNLCLKLLCLFKPLLLLVLFIWTKYLYVSAWRVFLLTINFKFSVMRMNLKKKEKRRTWRHYLNIFWIDGPLYKIIMHIGIK